MSPRPIYYEVCIEGKTDALVLPKWFPSVQFTPVGGKEQVKSRVNKQPLLHGLLDRDFVEDEAVAASQDQDSRLWILSRYSIENYLLEPAIIAGALRLAKKETLPDLQPWLNEEETRRVFLGWAQELSLYAAANALVARWREGIEAGFLTYFGPLPPLGRAEIVADLQQRLRAITSLANLESELDGLHRRVQHDITSWEGLHRWVNGKVLWERYLYPELFARLNIGQERARDLLIEAGQVCIPAELCVLSQRWVVRPMQVG